jgi:hypothetical protein
MIESRRNMLQEEMMQNNMVQTGFAEPFIRNDKSYLNQWMHKLSSSKSKKF